MKNTRTARTRTIYSNYDLWEKYPDDELRKIALDCGWVEDEEDITDSMLMDWRYSEDETDWDCEKGNLASFFKNKTVGFFGEVGLWDGIHKAGRIGEFWDLFYKATKDCDYINVYDENGRMYLTCSHHDGTNHFEIKVITNEGKEYLERWENDWNDKRTEQHCHNQIYKRYSKIPEFAHKVYGCKRKEYEPITKGKLIDKLNNMASSRYSA